MDYSMYMPDYTIGTDSFDKIPSVCKDYGKSIVFIGGKTAIEKAKPYLNDSLKDRVAGKKEKLEASEATCKEWKLSR